MTEPQIWAALGILAAAIISMITMTTKSVTRTITAQFGELRTEMVLRFERVDEQFTRVDERFTRVDERMDERFTRVDERFTRVDERMDERFDRVDERFDRLETRMSRLEERVQQLEHTVATIVADLRLVTAQVFPSSTQQNA